MKSIIKYQGINPLIGEEVFIADTSRVIGNVTIGNESSVWFGAVIRGDADSITIGSKSNIQDNAVIHVDPGAPVEIGDECIIGHCAIVHGAKLANNVLVGMHATILNGVEVGEYSIIGANALVTSNVKIPPYSLVLGSPAKVVGTIDETSQEKIRKNAEDYRLRSKIYLALDH